LERGKLVILSGPSGVGKDTVIDAWRKKNPSVARVVAYTTRASRPSEQPGVDYHFVTEDEFLQRAGAGDFLEYKHVHGNYYATPKSDMEAMLDEGRIAILKIDVQGALSVMPLRPDAITVFLLPPGGGELARRIRERGTEDAEAVTTRLTNAEKEMAFADRYQHRVVNDDVARVVDELEQIVRA
jgi:guanylate kinase